LTVCAKFSHADHSSEDVNVNVSTTLDLMLFSMSRHALAPATYK